MRVYVVGMSNTWALKHALPHYRGDGAYEVEYLFAKDPDPWQIDATTLRPEFFGDKLNADIVVSMLWGGWHLAFTLVEHPLPFDFAMPDDPTPPLPGRRLIPYNQVHAFVDSVVRRQYGLLEGLRKIVPGRLVHLESQPPIGSEDHLRTYPGPFAEAIKRRGITPASVRVKAWKVQNIVLKTICEEIGVEYLPFPDKAIGPDGCLRADLCKRDAGHANTKYGLMALDRIDALALEYQS